MHDRLSSVKAHIEKYENVNWDLVEVEVDMGKWAKFKAAFKRYIHKTWDNTRKLGGRVWNIFKFKMRKQEKECVEKHQKQEADAMKGAKMKSREEMAAKMTEEPKAGKQDKFESEMVGLLEGQQEKAEGLLHAKDEVGQVNEEQLKANVAHLKNAGESMERTFASGQNNVSKVDDVENQVENVAGVACDAKEWWIVKALKGIFSAIKKLGKGIKAVGEIALPTLGIRGIGGVASIIGGGVEEVIDFWNREIGLFAWGSVWAGTNSLTAGVGGYAGVGWKGYKLDWNLEETYQTAIFTTGGFSVPLPIVPPPSFGVSATAAVDADDSAGLPWIAVLRGWPCYRGYLLTPVVFSSLQSDPGRTQLWSSPLAAS